MGTPGYLYISFLARFKKISLPVPSDTLAVAVEKRHGWLIPPAWEFQSEVWEYEWKSPVSEIAYEHEGEVTIIK